MPVLLDEYGIFEGERIGRCSMKAQLYYPRFIMGANRLGRIRIDYHLLAGTICANFKPEDRPSEAELMGYVREYHQHRLLFIYQVENQLWGQFDVIKGTYGKWETKADKRSPSPPRDEYARWIDENRRNSSKTSRIAAPPGVTPDLPFENSGKTSEVLPQNFQSSSEEIPHAVAVAFSHSSMQLTDAVTVTEKPARAREASACEISTDSNEGKGLVEQQPSSVDSHIPNPPALNSTPNGHASTESIYPAPPNSDLSIAAIIQAHPRVELPVETERAIVDALNGRVMPDGTKREGLIKRFDGDANAAMRFLLDKAQLYKKCTDAWPPGERDYIRGSRNWFLGGCYDEKEETWRRNGKHQGNGSKSSSGAYRSDEESYDREPDFIVH